MLSVIYAWSVAVLVLANINSETPLLLEIADWIVAILFAATGSYLAWQEARKP